MVEFPDSLVAVISVASEHFLSYAIHENALSAACDERFGHVAFPNLTWLRRGTIVPWLQRHSSMIFS